MRFVMCLVVAVAVWGAACSGAFGDIVTSITLSPGVSGGERQWEMLAVDVGPVAGEVEVGVQDVRGGVQVVREVKGNLAGGGRVWMSLPLVGRAFLEQGKWPVEVMVRSGGREVERRRVVVELAGAGVGRRAVVAGEMPQGGQWGGLGPLIMTPVGVEEIVAGPALAFAGCDVVVLTPEVIGQLTESRALELMAAGVQLAAMGDRPPGGGLSGLVWQRLEGGEGAAIWVAPAPAGSGLRRPDVVEEGLQGVAEKLGERGLSRGGRNVRMAALWVGPVAGVVVVLVWGMFRPKRIVLMVSAVVMVVVAVVFVAAMQQAGGPREVEVAAWRSARGGEKEAVGGFWLEERLAVMGTVLGGRFEKSSAAGGIVLPVAGTEPGYWAMRDLQLVLRNAEQGGGAELRGALPGGSRVFLEARRVGKAGLLPVLPRSAEERAALAEMVHVGREGQVWVEGGYVYLNDMEKGHGVSFSEWALRWEGSDGDSLRIWDQLRCDVSHRYFLFDSDGVENVIDFGVP